MEGRFPGFHDDTVRSVKAVVAVPCVSFVACVVARILWVGNPTAFIVTSRGVSETSHCAHDRRTCP